MDWSDRIGRRIKLRDLHILMAVADTGSMAKAAARLRISHPAISKTISDLEATLGVRLLDRGSQGAELTAVCTENLIPVDDMMESPKLAE
jgi:molybdenum-dependent DNA-binding transcriptional regulator ModE